jgi:hypothetical protein
VTTVAGANGIFAICDEQENTPIAEMKLQRILQRAAA